ncbi:MAG TPA: sulfotransferase [Jatrophihabitantaceae bacterium]|nr:sulfotransferase [Jatrophihabitantaceae bacterium]
MSQEFSPDAIVERARASTGLHDLGSEHVRDYLEAWCADLDAPLLSDAGRARLARLAVRNLETRLRVEDTVRRHPEILDVQLPRIVRIAGLARSGTTLLHQLLALGPARRALLRWELLEPVPPTEAPTYADDPRIDRVARSMQALRGTDLQRMHWVEATDPEECTWGFYDLSGLLGRGCLSAMPRWTEAILDSGRDHRHTYVEYRRLVQLLLWRNPLPAGGTLVLKCPTDNDCLGEFIDVFPEAAIVQIHRDPFRTVTSACRIQQVINQPFFAEGTHISDAQLLTQVRSKTAPQADALVNVSQSHPNLVTNVRYADLMAQPAATVDAVEERLGLPDRGAAANRVAGLLERQRSGGRVAPPAAYDDFGATPDRVHGEPAFARYIATFDIPAERERVSVPRS